MISAVVLTHNDEATIAKTLKSLTWCDEVVVIDDVSTDKTVVIVKKFTDKIFERPLDGDFATQRNFGLSKTKGVWVLFVDSDEVVTPRLAKEIRQAILNSQFSIFNSFFLKRRDWMWGRELKYGEQGNMKLLRLAKKDAGRWVRPVHEVWSPYAKASGDKKGIGELKEPLLHFPHPSVAQYLEEINRYSSLNASYLYKQGVRPHWWHIVAYPISKFFLNYIIRLGFLDGTAGTVVAVMMSMHSFLTRAKLWQLWDKHV